MERISGEAGLLRRSPALDGPDGASADPGGGRSELIAAHWTPGFMVTTSVGTRSRPPLTNRRANGRARLASQARLSGPQGSVTALRKLRMGTPGLRAEAGPTAGASRPD